MCARYRVVNRQEMTKPCNALGLVWELEAFGVLNSYKLSNGQALTSAFKNSWIEGGVRYRIATARGNATGRLSMEEAGEMSAQKAVVALLTHNRSARGGCEVPAGAAASWH